MKFTNSQSAVSNVVGGILFFALVVTLFIVIRVNFVPVWEAEREADHMETVQGQFAQIKADVDRMVANRTQAGVSDPITLSRTTGSRVFATPGLPGSIEFRPGTAGMNLSANELFVYAQNGSSYIIPDEKWKEITSTASVIDISSVAHMRVRVLDPGNAGNGNSFTLTVFDKNGNYAGDMRVIKEGHPSGYSIKSRVRTATNTILYDQGESFFQQDKPALYWVDTFASDTQFGNILRSAEPPLKIQFSSSQLRGEYTITYVSSSAGVLVGGTGRLITNFESELPSGRLEFTSTNTHYVQQNLLFSNGAVILSQPDGSAFLVPPSFDVRRAGSTVILDLSLPRLSGVAEGSSKRGVATVDNAPGPQTIIEGSAPSFTFNVTTSYPGLWSQFMEERLVLAGLSKTAGHYVITQGTGWIKVTVYGLTTPPASTIHDIRVELQHAVIYTTIPV
jgi:hypothetical protein